MIVIIDYGIGNLRSMEKALQAVGADVIRSDRAEDIQMADKVVLPGVGAFGACADEIRRRDLEQPILAAIASGKPFLGVCVGMQLLFDEGLEMGTHAGLGVLRGRVLRFDAVPELAGVSASGRPDPAPWDEALKIPHMGWNTLEEVREDVLLADLPEAPYFYFVHSYIVVPDDPDDVLASCRYGVRFPAIVHRNNVYGVQFHPEKSQRNGLRVLKNFADRVR